MRKCLFVVAALLITAGVLWAQDWTDTGTVSVDLGSSDIVLTSHNTDSSIAYGYHENRRLPVSFEVVVANGQATLKDHKVYLTDGDVSLRLVFESGETSWSVELPMKKDKGD